MNKIVRTEELFADKIVEIETKKTIIRKTVKGRNLNITLEFFECGHQNNLALEGNKTGICPKGCS